MEFRQWPWERVDHGTVDKIRSIAEVGTQEGMAAVCDALFDNWSMRLCLSDKLGLGFPIDEGLLSYIRPHLTEIDLSLYESHVAPLVLTLCEQGGDSALLCVARLISYCGPQMPDFNARESSDISCRKDVFTRIAAKHPHPRARTRAKIVLSLLGDKRFIDVCISLLHIYLRQGCWYHHLQGTCLLKLEQEARCWGVTDVLTCFDISDSFACLAIKALGRLRYQEAGPLLLQLAEANGAPGPIRAAACEALGYLDYPSSLDLFLTAIIKHDDPRKHEAYKGLMLTCSRLSAEDSRRAISELWKVCRLYNETNDFRIFVATGNLSGFGGADAWHIARRVLADCAREILCQQQRRYLTGLRGWPLSQCDCPPDYKPEGFDQFLEILSKPAPSFLSK